MGIKMSLMSFAKKGFFTAKTQKKTVLNVLLKTMPRDISNDVA